MKGIYHELLFAQAENLDGDDVSARLFEETNHPGADVEFVVDGDVIEVIQLKAVTSPAAILEHLAKYPDIGVAATSEVAARVSGVSDSGFRVGRRRDDLKDSTLQQYRAKADRDLDRLLATPAPHPAGRALQTQVKAWRTKFFVFLEDRRVSATNNVAEREIVACEERLLAIQRRSGVLGAGA